MSYKSCVADLSADLLQDSQPLKAVVSAANFVLENRILLTESRREEAAWVSAQMSLLVANHVLSGNRNDGPVVKEAGRLLRGFAISL